MKLFRRRTIRTGASFVALAGVLALSLTVPVPSVPDRAEAAVIRVIAERLPGWKIERINRSWEGAYSIVTMCAGREMGFQYVPGHGLGPDAAWLQPNDLASRERLAAISDHWRHLVWYDDPAMIDTLSCEEEIAGGNETASGPNDYD
jgi:hypothetical protein